MLFFFFFLDLAFLSFFFWQFTLCLQKDWSNSTLGNSVVVKGFISIQEKKADPLSIYYLPLLSSFCCAIMLSIVFFFFFSPFLHVPFFPPLQNFVSEWVYSVPLCVNSAGLSPILFSDYQVIHTLCIEVTQISQNLHT